jgi:hypothetical protein
MNQVGLFLVCVACMAVMACSWSLALGKSLKPSSIGVAPEKHFHAQHRGSSVGLFPVFVDQDGCWSLASGELMKPCSELLSLKENFHA